MDVDGVDGKTEFIIKNKPIIFKIAVAFTVTSVALAFTVALVIIACRIDGKIAGIWALEVVPAVSLALSALGLFAYYKEEFSLKDGEFRYIKLFKKPIGIKVDTLNCVYLRQFGRVTKIEFMNKKGEIAGVITDDGTVLQDGIFLTALERLNISVERRGYDK